MILGEKLRPRRAVRSCRMSCSGLQGTSRTWRLSRQGELRALAPSRRGRHHPWGVCAPRPSGRGACSLYCSVHPLFLVQVEGLKPRGSRACLRSHARWDAGVWLPVLPSFLQAIPGRGSTCPAGGRVHLAPVPLDATVTREALLGEVRAALLLGQELGQGKHVTGSRLCAQVWGLGRGLGAGMLREARAPSRTA